MDSGDPVLPHGLCGGPNVRTQHAARDGAVALFIESTRDHTAKFFLGAQDFTEIPDRGPGALCVCGLFDRSECGEISAQCFHARSLLNGNSLSTPFGTLPKGNRKSAPMPSQDSPIVAARRRNLRSWINDSHGGVQADFIAAYKLNQSEISGLLNDKSFGEKKAEALERQVPKMPRGYLLNPLAHANQLVNPGSDDAADVELRLVRHDNDILILRSVINTLLVSLTKTTPSAAADVKKTLRKLPGHAHGYLAEAIRVLGEAQRMTAEEQLAALDREVSPGGKKT